jgi:hypothetical protein
MLEPPKLSYVIVNQLAAWEKLAEDWPVSHDAQYGGDYTSSGHRDQSYRCGDCGKGVALAFDSQGRRYLYTDAQWLALVVLHLRNHHSALDPDKA